MNTTKEIRIHQVESDGFIRETIELRDSFDKEEPQNFLLEVNGQAFKLTKEGVEKIEYDLTKIKPFFREKF